MNSSHNILRAKTHLPNFPKEVFDIWLAQLINDEGWPFYSSASLVIGSWNSLLLGHSLSFWRSLSWSRVNVSFGSERQFDVRSREHIGGIIDAHVRGINNAYKRGVRNSDAKWQRILKYVSFHSTVPAPVILLQHFGSFQIADGCHRIAALFTDVNPS